PTPRPSSTAGTAGGRACRHARDRHAPQWRHTTDGAPHRRRLGACLVPFAFAPVGVTIACFAIGGLIYGPFIPLTYALFQSATTTANPPGVLALEVRWSSSRR